MPRVRVHQRFQADLVAQLRWLRDDEALERIVQLREDLRAARKLLGRFAHVGSIEGENDGRLRRLILKRVPYVVWFLVEDGGATVTLVRLFHARQARPKL